MGDGKIVCYEHDIPGDLINGYESGALPSKKDYRIAFMRKSSLVGLLAGIALEAGRAARRYFF